MGIGSNSSSNDDGGDGGGSNSSSTLFIVHGNSAANLHLSLVRCKNKYGHRSLSPRRWQFLLFWLSPAAIVSLTDSPPLYLRVPGILLQVRASQVMSRRPCWKPKCECRFFQMDFLLDLGVWIFHQHVKIAFHFALFIFGTKTSCEKWAAHGIQSISCARHKIQIHGRTHRLSKFIFGEK